MTETKPTIASLLRRAADLIDAHPSLPEPVVTAYSSGNVDVSWQLMNNAEAKDDQKPVVRRIVKALGGPWDKREYGGDTMYLNRKLDGLSLCIHVTREQVCERVVTGEETYTVPAKPAEPARIETRELVEWRCEPVLAEAIS